MANEGTDTCVDMEQRGMAMSRGEKPEVILDFGQIENLPVWDEYGQRIRFGDLYKDQKTIVIFIRVSSGFQSNLIVYIGFKPCYINWIPYRACLTLSLGV